MVTDEEVAAACGVDMMNWGAAPEEERTEFIKSTVREKWCRQDDKGCDNYVSSDMHADGWELDLVMMDSSHCQMYVPFKCKQPSELDCWKEALVWLDKKEKEDATM